MRIIGEQCGRIGFFIVTNNEELTDRSEGFASSRARFLSTSSRCFSSAQRDRRNKARKHSALRRLVFLSSTPAKFELASVNEGPLSDCPLPCTLIDCAGGRYTRVSYTGCGLSSHLRRGKTLPIVEFFADQLREHVAVGWGSAQKYTCTTCREKKKNFYDSTKLVQI